MTAVSKPKIATSTHQRRRRFVWFALAVTLLTAGIAPFSTSLIEKPALPLPATGNEVPVVNHNGYSMAFPEGWTAAPHGLPGGMVGLTNGRPSCAVGNGPRMQAILEFMPGGDSRRATFEPQEIQFQSQPATLRAGRYTYAQPPLRNLKRVWKGRSLNSWKPAQTTAHWYLEFERAGREFCLHYSAPCGSFARIDATEIPSEIMSYFQTFHYDPKAQVDPSKWWSQSRSDPAGAEPKSDFTSPGSEDRQPSDDLFAQ